MAGNPIQILAILLLAVALSDWLGRQRGFRHASAAGIVILLGAALANAGVLPVATDGIPVYDMIFALVTPAAIFLVLLEANLASLRRAGPRMLFAFGAGAVGTLLGVLAAAAWVPLPDIGARLGPLAGMFAATYIGGSANFNAVALEHGMAAEGTLYAAAIVVDNVMTMAWIVVTLLLPRLMRWLGGVAALPMEQGAPEHVAPPEPLPDTLALALPLGLAVASVAVSAALSGLAAAAGTRIPSILLVTTLALLLAQLPIAARLTMAKPLGIWGMYLFLAAVGASADLGALAQSGSLGVAMFGFIAVILLVHLVVVVAFGLATRTDPDVIAIASTANIGGATTAFALAESFGRKDLVLPGILAGTLGTALGTYVGLAVAGLL